MMHLMIAGAVAGAGAQAGLVVADHALGRHDHPMQLALPAFGTLVLTGAAVVAAAAWGDRAGPFRGIARSNAVEHVAAGTQDLHWRDALSHVGVLVSGAAMGEVASIGVEAGLLSSGPERYPAG
jgi:hypothetical protein